MPLSLIFVFLFFLGLAIGSFLNVVVYRLNHAKNPLRGRSFCDHCQHQLAWADNLPLASFILLKGKCRYCRSPISWQYPLVELATAVLSIIVFQWAILNFNNFLITGYYLVIAYLLIAVFVSDLLYQTIPDEVSCPGIIFSLIFALVTRQFGFLMAGSASALFFLFLHLITRGKGMAMGDVKLAFFLGLFLGGPRLIFCLYLAFLTGALAGVILILTKRKRFGQQIPFGPFLTTSALASIFWGDKIISFYLRSFIPFG
jgi:leader peptidase (prepilin peptidase)/N-methyltransferase